MAAISDLQATVQRRVLDVLAEQIMLGGLALSTSMELCRLGLESLHQILQASGHTLLTSWETILEVLGSICRPAHSDLPSQLAPSLPGRRHPPPLGYLQERGYLATLLPEHLCLCVSTLGQFGRQADTNIALAAAESLFWGVLDAIQTKQ